jgi:hypothetical protein
LYEELHIFDHTYIGSVLNDTMKSQHHNQLTHDLLSDDKKLGLNDYNNMNAQIFNIEI